MPPYDELNPALTPEQQGLKAGVHQFAELALRPAAWALDKLPGPREVMAPGSPLWTTLAAAYAQGFHTALIPTSSGGLGLSGLALHVALEELGWGSSEFAASIAVSGWPFAMVAAGGNAALIREVVAPFVADKQATRVGCWALTEPSSGSDQFMASTHVYRDTRLAGPTNARADGDAWVVNGEKAAWISNGTIATHALVHLSVERAKGIAGNGIAFIPLDLPGVSKGDPLDKLGQRALNQGSMRFRDVRIPRRYMIVEPAGYEVALTRTLALTNAAVSAIFVGVARAAYEEAFAYARGRVQGGQPLVEHQLVQKHLFDMYTLVESSRALSRAATIRNTSSEPPVLEASIAAKTYCTQAAFDVASTALQLFGGTGLKRDQLIEKLFRDARASLIEDGVNDILALVGARRLIEHAPRR